MKNNMASLVGFFCILATMNALDAVDGASNEFKVGESGGWRLPDANNTEMYNQWAAKSRFLVGDSLYFEYEDDSVLVVDKRGYYHCNTTNPIFVFDDGKTVIKLDKPGPFYFISGGPDHCKNGQRLVINVLTPQSPPPVAVPPQPFPTDADADSPSPSPNSHSGVAVVSDHMSVPILLTLTTTLAMFVWGAPHC